jgi:hypothetical protein
LISASSASLKKLKMKRTRWLALEDDFRTPGIGQIVAAMPRFSVS